MPLHIGSLTPTGPAAPIVEDVYDAAWLAPDGTLWPLMAPESGYWSLDSVAGYGAAPIVITTDPSPAGGVVVRGAPQPQARYLTWPLRVQPDAGGHMAMVGKWRDLMRAFTQTSQLGPGTLYLYRPDGTTRSIRAWYQSGFEQGTPGNLGGWLYEIAVLTLLCEDPYWLDTDTLQVAGEYTSEPQPELLNPMFTVAFGQVIGSSATINNPGDVDAYPVWTVTGPFDDVTATNLTTGQSWTLTPPGGLGDGESAVVAAGRQPTVRGPAGEKWLGYLNLPDAQFWTLPRGTNTVQFDMTNPDTGSKITMAFVPRYESS